MHKILKVTVLLFIIAIIVVQFFQPEKNSGELTPNHIFQNEKVPDEVMNTIKNACMDCHSDQTRYLWYHKISPVSWMIYNHIKDGKKELNFSTWGEQDAYDKFGAFEDISKEVERKTMPLKSYAFMHGKARLSDDERKVLVDWAKLRSEQITNELKE